jgi:uncharacterized protein (DUF58 family)
MPGVLAAPAAQVPRSITLEVPARNAVVREPVEVRGRVTVGPFENNLRGRVYDADGHVIGEGPVMVTPDAPGTLGGPGSFRGTIPVRAPHNGPARVEVAELSMRDGAMMASANQQVTLRPGGAAAGPGPTQLLAPGAATLGILVGVLVAIRRRKRA